MRFSIMISVYNAEDYLPACLDSVLAQTFSDYEVILVDDGSVDGSDKICDRMAEQDRRFRVFHTENHGVFHARQFAESHAKGDYLLHFDADDLVEPALLERLSEAIEHYTPDLLFYDFSTFRGDEGFRRETFGTEDKLLSSEDLPELYKLIFSTRFNTLCNKCFHRSLISAAPDYKAFSGIRHGEDLLRSAHLVLGAERVYYLHESFYNYRLGVGHAGNFDGESLLYYDRVVRELYTLLQKRVTINGDWETVVNDLCRKQLENYVRLLSASRTRVSDGVALLRNMEKTELFRRALDTGVENTRLNLLRHKHYRTLLLLQRGKGWLHA